MRHFFARPHQILLSRRDQRLDTFRPKFGAEDLPIASLIGSDSVQRVEISRQPLPANLHVVGCFIQQWKIRTDPTAGMHAFR